VSDAPAIALVEFASIAAGTRAADALVKKAPVELLRAGTYQPGRFAVLFGGQVAAVEESLLAACQAGAACLLDHVLLPDVEPTVRAAILGKSADWSPDTLGIIETPTLAAVVEAADAAVKGARVCLAQLRLGDGLGGKGLAYFTGEQADVEAALEIGLGRAGNRPATAGAAGAATGDAGPHLGPPCITIIPRWDEAVRAKLSASTRFGEGW
jgi:microcompartment protein CcmL/EutN